MRVFISYSGRDLHLVEYLEEALEGVAEVDYWNTSRSLGEPDWPQIFEWIEEADMVLVVITDKTVRRAMSVGQEIGHAKALGKPIIPLVAHGVPRTELGCLGGVAYQNFDVNDFEQAVDLVVEAVDARRRKQNTNALIGLGLLGGLALLAGRKNQQGPGGAPPSGPYL